MTDTNGPQVTSTTKEKKCFPSTCCNDYCNELSLKAFQKKPISIDLDHLLRTQLNRCLRTMDLIGYGIAAMVGGTIFVLTGTIARNKSGPATFVSYILAGFIAILNATTYAELSCRFPKAGSTYTYVYVLLGELPAFLAGWSIFLEYILSISTVARGWSSSLDALTGGAITNWTTESVGRLDKPNGFFAEELDFAAAGLVILVVVTTCFGMEKSACLNLVFTAINVGVLTLAAVFMLVHAQPDLLFIPLPKNVSWTSVLPLVNLTPFLPYGITGLVAGTATCFNAFIGFDMMSMCAEEANDPGKSIPRANVISVLLVTLLLSVSTLALLMYIPWYLLDIGAPFLEAMRNGPGDTTARSVLFYIVGIGCLIGLFSNLLTSALGAPRILYAMGQDGLVFTGFAKVTEPFKTPLIASIPVAVISSLLTMVFSISSLADFMCLGTLIAYSMCSLGVLILRYCPAPEKLIAAVRIPESSVNAKIDQEKEELAIKYGDTIETKDQTSSMKYDFPGASNIDKPGYLKAGWAKLLPSTLVKHMTMNREPGEVCKTNIGFFVLFVLLLHFTVLIAPYTVSSGWTYWRVAGAILWLISLLCCGIVFSMHRQFPGSRPNLFRLPMVPFLPCVTVVFNAVLISQLSWMTWARFFIWVALGSIIYFAYGVCHSHPTDDTETDVLLDKKE
ncbi:Cationic amino acid transporter 2 [Echinococcus granulosus]|uniref:Cationic amino acid transporter 4 n=1 Tax=Echinococcus granulosus TaxID=6210 RepID=A0A068WC23_ECHGR|nr:Cationic amino acid transporter 2 [Echinococcus granulosus]CDS17231.1 cationic amino acid transporter 4 [Echinococcus granulosus]